MYVVLLVQPTFCATLAYPFLRSLRTYLPCHRQKRDFAEELLARVKVKGYRMGAYKEENEVRVAISMWVGLRKTETRRWAATCCERGMSLLCQKRGWC
jgi:hypothetical protein